MLYGRRLDQSLQHVDGSRYALVHAVAKRARQITLWLTADPAELRAEAAPPPAPGELTSRDPVALAEAEILDGEVKVRWDPEGLADEAALLELDELETDPLLLEGLDDDEVGRGRRRRHRPDPRAGPRPRGRRDRGGRRGRGRGGRGPGRRGGGDRGRGRRRRRTRSRRSPSRRSRSPTRATTKRTPSEVPAGTRDIEGPGRPGPSSLWGVPCSGLVGVLRAFRFGVC